MVCRSRIEITVWHLLCLLLIFGESSSLYAGDIPLTVRTEGNWQIVESPNFRCRSQLSSPEAKRLAECCEVWRTRLRKTWISRADTANWLPKCEVYVHSDRAAYNQALNRPGDVSVGSTQMNFDQSRTVFRRVDVRSDAIDWSNAALPHELTHVVLGERFGGHALPRWADEGIAMLSESPEKHRDRLVSLKQIISRRQALPLDELVKLNRMPAAHQRDAFYGQSVALTSLLVRQSSPATFADFIETSQQQGIAAALKRHYQTDGVTGLQRDWDRWTHSVDAIEFVSLQLHTGLDPIVASIRP